MAQQKSAERREAWRAANSAACRHLRTCQDCTGGFICADALKLERAVWLAEPGMLVPDEEPIIGDDRPPFWLEIVTIVVVNTMLLACVFLGWAAAKWGVL